MNTTLERFQGKYRVSSDTGCWLWNAATDKYGYGKFGWVTQRPKRIVLAHRASWMLHKGEIPDGLNVLHRCDTPACVNPEHLFLGTQAENVEDCYEKGRTPRGTRHGNSKLTDADVVAIKAAKGSQEAIASEFGVDRSLVSMIKSGARWAHVE